METTTSSPNTVASPQPQRRRNRWILWTGRILLGLLGTDRPAGGEWRNLRGDHACQRREALSTSGAAGGC
jgi:hypothetical protein